MITQAEGIREQSARYSRVQNLMHKVNEETLMSEHRKQSRRKAVGADGISKEQYDENAAANIRELTRKMREFQYKPKPVKRVYIPKTNGKLHYPSCSAVEQMKDSNKAYTEDFDGAVASGYVPCKKCNPTGKNTR